MMFLVLWGSLKSSAVPLLHHQADLRTGMGVRGSPACTICVLYFPWSLVGKYNSKLFLKLLLHQDSHDALKVLRSCEARRWFRIFEPGSSPQITKRVEKKKRLTRILGSFFSIYLYLGGFTEMMWLSWNDVTYDKHMYARENFPDSLLMSVKWHISRCLREVVSPLHPNFSTVPERSKVSFSPTLHSLFSPQLVELLSLQQLLIPEGPQCQTPQVPMTFSSKSGCLFLCIISYPMALTLHNNARKFWPSAAIQHYVGGKDLISTGNLLSSLQPCVFCVSRL